jgi:glycogen debranching enzyme
VSLETLIDGYTFLATAGPDELGDAGGLYHRDTRYLSTFAVDVADARLVPVGQTIDAANARTVTLATAGPAVNAIDEGRVPKHAELVVRREQSVHEGTGYAEVVAVDNHAATAMPVEVTVRFASDFADLFEVRGLDSGLDRELETAVEDRRVTNRYRYPRADGGSVERACTVRFGVEPDDLGPASATFAVEIDPQGRFELPVSATIDGRRLEPATPPARTPPIDLPTVATGTSDYDAVFERAAADLTALATRTDYGAVALAGTPWFATPFGRDAVIAAHQVLPVAPALATGTLRYFAAHRGRTVAPDREEEPGKVFHEVRHGELADRELIPHTPYFGTVDATPLWVLLLADACRWRGDDAPARELADALADALGWIARASDAVADDPFVYYPATAGVLDHRAWKDTADSIRYADGEVAEGPLAVAEVQGYAAAALREGASLLERVTAAGNGTGLDADGDGADATGRDVAPDATGRDVAPDAGRSATTVDAVPSPGACRERAAAIERAFDEAFWLPERSFYGVAKAGDGRIVDAVASNVGHCLWTGTVPDARADAVAETLVDGPLASGWGVRTMSPTAAGYSPVSYHAGGVWPHDTAFAALGLARYGYHEAAEQLGRAVLDAASHFDHRRLPELYCGFGDARDPVEYPAACTPQAWAAGAPFAFLRAAFDPEPTDDGVEIGRSSGLFDDSAAAALVGNW